MKTIIGVLFLGRTIGLQESKPYYDTKIFYKLF